MQIITTPAKRAALFVSVQLLGLGLLAGGCAPKQPAQPAQPAPQAQAQPAPQTGLAFLGYFTDKHGKQLSGHDIRNTPPFSTAYRALLRRNKLRDSWLTHFDAPAKLVCKVRINGAEYLHVEGCKAHSCGANNITVLYSHDEKAIYARLTQNNETVWLGEPPDEIKQVFGQLQGIEPPK